MDKKDIKHLAEQHREKWGVNEGLLQSYRQIHISTQSIFIAIGAILLDYDGTGSIWMFLILAVVGIFMIWVIWYETVRVRALIVDYHKYHYLYLQEKQKEPDGVCSVDEYVKNSAKREKTNKKLGIEKNFRKTRVKIDQYLPGIFTIIWLTLFFFKLFA